MMNSRTIAATALILTIAVGCKKDDDDVNGSGVQPPVPEAFHFKVTVDGTEMNYTDGVSDYHILPGAMGSCDQELTECTSFQETVVSHAAYVENRWRIGLIKTFTGLSGSSPSMQQQNSMVLVGGYPWGSFINVGVFPDVDYNILDGVRIQWTDPTGVEWSTDRGNGGQEESAFYITEVVATGASDGPRFTIHCAFNCTLYNANGEAKVVTGGRHYGPIIVS